MVMFYLWIPCADMNSGLLNLRHTGLWTKRSGRRRGTNSCSTGTRSFSVGFIRIGTNSELRSSGFHHLGNICRLVLSCCIGWKICLCKCIGFATFFHIYYRIVKGFHLFINLYIHYFQINYRKGHQLIEFLSEFKIKLYFLNNLKVGKNMCLIGYNRIFIDSNS